MFGKIAANKRKLITTKDLISIREKVLLDHLDQFVVGQENPKRAVASKIVNISNRLIKVKRPICSLLFIGPTGVGKTEIMRGVSSFLLGDPDRFTVFNCDSPQERPDMRQIESVHLNRFSRDIFLQKDVDTHLLEHINNKILRFESLARKKGGLNFKSRVTFEELMEKRTQLLRSIEFADDLTSFYGGEKISIVVFENIDKADEEILDTFKKIIENARFDFDYVGSDYHNTIITMTLSNFSKRIIDFLKDNGFFKGRAGNGMGEGGSFPDEDALDELSDRDIPDYVFEFLKFIGNENILIFNELTDPEMMKIIETKLSNIPPISFSGVCKNLSFTKKFKRAILKNARSGLNKTLGATPIDRILEAEVTENMIKIALPAYRDEILSFDHRVKETIEFDFYRGETVIRIIDR